MRALLMTAKKKGGWQPLNPMCWYKFDGDYTDSAGNFGVASGTSSFQTLSSGVQVLQTDGTNLVSLPSGITANSISTYTIAFWMKPITTNPSYGYYAGCGYADSTHISFYESTSGRDYVEWYGGNRDLTTSGVGAGWRMVCLRSNGSTCDLVVNGNNKTATTTSPSIFGYSTDNIFVLGARTPNVPAVTGQRTSVQISNFVISNSYWDDTELMEMYNATKDNYPWQPGANTVAYYPLTSSSTVNDMSGNNKNMTQSGTVTYGTNGGVDCAYFNGGYLSINESFVLGANPRTISCWYYRTNATSEGGAFWGMGNANANNGITAYVGTNPGTDLGKIAYGNWSWDESSGEDVEQNVWHLLTFTYDGSILKMYKDGVWLSSRSGQTFNITNGKTTICQMPNIYSRTWKGYMSEFIFEDVSWSAQEVADYYNSTKDNYTQNRNSNNIEENYIKIEPTEDIHITPNENDNGSGDLQKF